MRQYFIFSLCSNSKIDWSVDNFVSKLNENSRESSSSLRGKKLCHVIIDGFSYKELLQFYDE
jgi:hypothetical protein